MSLPVVINDADQHWSCQACGICCRGSIVALNDEDLARLVKQDWGRHPDFRGLAIVEKHGSGHRLAHRDDGCCVFLQDDGLCRIHAEQGYDAKPTMCRVFPLQLVPHESQSVLTLRCACPTVAQNHGDSLELYTDTVKGLVKKGELKSETIRPPMLKRGEIHPWKSIQVALDAIAKLLTDQHFPVVRRLVHALQWAALVESNPTRRLDNKELTTLLRQLHHQAIDNAGVFFRERTRPGAGVNALFRLTLLEHIRLLPSHRPKNTWGQRIAMMKSAWRMVRGKGGVPDLQCDLPRATFSQLEQPLGALLPEVTDPFAHWIETTASSGLFALANRGGWALTESLRALALAYAVGLYLLRWQTAEKESATEDDVLPIVVALDRGHGFAPLSGAQHRWRLWAIHKLGGFEPLLAWWSR